MASRPKKARCDKNAMSRGEIAAIGARNRTRTHVLARTSVLPTRRTGVPPLLIKHHQQYQHARAQVVPRGNFNFELTVPERIDEGQECERGNEPVGENNFIFLAEPSVVRHNSHTQQSYKSLG